MTYKQTLEAQIEIDSRNLRKVLSWEKVVRCRDQIVIALNIRILDYGQKIFNASLWTPDFS